MIAFWPTRSDDVDIIAIPAEFMSVLPTGLAPSRKITVPEGVSSSGDLVFTSAVIVTGCSFEILFDGQLILVAVSTVGLFDGITAIFSNTKLLPAPFDTVSVTLKFPPFLKICIGFES